MKIKDKQIIGSCLRDENAEEHEDDGETSCSLRPWNGS